MARPAFSVVIPCYRSEAALPELFERLSAQFDRMDQTWELICVDDCSPDRTAEVVRAARQHDRRIKLVQHFRNYGQHQALLTGFRHARGHLVVTMDDDLQHPPEEIPRLVEALGDYDVVIAAPEARKHAAHKNLGSVAMGWILKTVFKPPPGYVASAFRLMRDSVANHLATTHTVFPYVSGMILQTTGNVTNIQVRHDERRHGASNYSLTGLVRLASNLVINYTRIPLQMLVGIGILISLISFGFIVRVGYNKLFVTNYEAGWTSLIMVIGFFGGLNLLGLAVVGEYMSRLLSEVSAGSRVVIRQALVDDDPADSDNKPIAAVDEAN